MNESPDYSALDLSRLVRHYAALSPSNPRMMASPPFPTEKYLVRTRHQAELFAALSPLDVTPDSAVSLDTKACRWKYAFWKRIIQVIETTSAEGISPDSEVCLYITARCCSGGGRVTWHTLPVLLR